MQNLRKKTCENAVSKLSDCRLAVGNSKESPNQEIGLENRGHLKVLNDTKVILND